MRGFRNRGFKGRMRGFAIEGQGIPPLARNRATLSAERAVTVMEAKSSRASTAKAEAE